MITLKEMLAEPQTMYDGGMVQHMSEGGMPLTIVEVPDKPEGIRHLLNDTKFGRSASDPAYITPNQTTMRTYDKKPVSLSLEQLKDIPGASGEERFRADPEAFGGVGKYGPLRESIKRKGYQDYEGNPLTTDPITLEVNSKGEAVIAEGNHRLAEAIESGRDSVPVHIQYYGGSENIEGPYNPDRLQLGPRVLKEGEKGAIRLSPEKFQSLTEQLPEVEQQLSITEQQPSVTKKSTLPVPKRIKEKLLRNIRNFIPLIKAGRSLSPVGIALNLLQIIPEETMNNAVDYLKNTPTHELFGLEKSGLESVEDLWEEVKGHLITQTEPTEITAQYIRNLDLYHATTATKLIGGKLKASKVGVLGQGVYATPDTEYAGGYAEGEGGNIHPVKANIENPLIVRIKGRFHHYTPARVFEELGVSKEKAFEMAERNSEEHGGDFTTQFKSRARKQGYDSIVLVNDETNTMQEIVVFDPDKIVSKFKPMYDGGLVQHMSEGGEPTETLKMSVFDEEYDEYIKNLEGSTSDLFNDNVMRDVLDSFSVSSKSLEEVNPKELSLPIPEKRLDLYKKLELEPPSSKEGALTVGSLDWYKDYNLLAPPMTYEQLLKRRYGLELIDLDWDVSHIIERPSSSTVTEQQLPVTTKPTLPVPKSLESKLPKIVGTILKARKYTNPLGLAAQVLDLIPQETKAAAVDYLKNTPTHELFGLEKSGLESVEDLWEEVKNNLTTETEPSGKLESMRNEFYNKIQTGIQDYQERQRMDNMLKLEDRLQEKLPMVIDTIIGEITKDNPYLPDIASSIVDQLDDDLLSKKDIDKITWYLSATSPDKLFGLQKSGDRYIGDLWNKFYDQSLFFNMEYYNDEPTRSVDKKVKKGQEVPQQELPVIPQSEYIKEFGNPSSLINKKSIEKLLEKHPNILVDSDGLPVLLFRGSRLVERTPEEITSILKGESRKDYFSKPKDYSTFLADNPYLSATYAGDKTSEGVLIPFFIKAKEIIDFPIQIYKDKSGRIERLFDKVRFDREARQLKKGQVLVARSVRDTGPDVNLEFDSNKFRYGHNQYAVADEGQLINAIAEKKKGGQVRPMYDGGLVLA